MVFILTTYIVINHLHTYDYVNEIYQQENKHRNGAKTTRHNQVVTTLITILKIEPVRLISQKALSESVKLQHQRPHTEE